MSPATLQERKAAVIERLEQGKAAFLATVRNIPASIASQGTIWAPMDVVRHIEVARPAVARGGFLFLARKALEEDNPEIPDYTGDPEQQWKHFVDRAARAMDEVIEFVRGLPDEQLERQGRRGGKPYTVIEMLERYASHNQEHADQIKNEILPRLRQA